MLYYLILTQLANSLLLSAVPAITTVPPQAPVNAVPVVGSNGAVTFNGQTSAAAAGASEVPAVSVAVTTLLPFVTSVVKLSYTPPTFTSGVGDLSTSLDYSGILNKLDWLPVLQSYYTSMR